MHQDMGRWAQRYGVAFALNPHFPINTLALMRVAIAYQMKKPQAFDPYLEAVFRAMWVTGRNLGDSTELAATLGAAGLDSGEFVQMIGDAEVKAKLVADTAEAVERGVFGAPSFFVGKDMFFGQDRLEFVRAALLGG
jgi:2-hydroxychromene-2-carboxylate isomerase